MKYTNTHFVGAKDCPFTYRGENLAAMRRAKLNKLAQSLQIDVKPTDSKNDIVVALMVRCKALGKLGEITADV